MAADRPSLPIPAPLRGSQSGSWAERSLRWRLPEIGRRAANERRWPDEVGADLLRLAEEVPDGRIEPLHDPGAPDADAWQPLVAPQVGMTWLEVPWFFAETYFYRRLLAASGYFQPGATHGLDPFGPEKQRGLDQGLASAEPAQRRTSLADLLLSALWGNRADLSMWPTAPGGSRNADPEGAPLHRLLVDDRPAVLAHLGSLPDGPKRIDVVLDNAGQELLADLALARGLLQAHPGCQLVLHVKSHPTFVSDATQQDVDGTLRQASATGGELSVLGDDLELAGRRARLRVTTDGFWTSPLAGWEFPSHLRQELASSDLVIFKGDANYRRLLGDRHWPYTTPFEAVLSYFPAPVLCLRALKADVAAGLDPPMIEDAGRADGDWMIDGRWALIQFADHK